MRSQVERVSDFMKDTRDINTLAVIISIAQDVRNYMDSPRTNNSVEKMIARKLLHIESATDGEDSWNETLVRASTGEKFTADDVKKFFDELKDKYYTEFVIERC